MSHPTSTDVHWRRLHAHATQPYRRAGRFAWHFARGKLGRDPVFRWLVEQGQIAAGHRRVLDIGCGQGLLASLLSSMSQMQAGAQWPSHWSPTPQAPSYTGIELMSRDVERAERSIGHLRPAPAFVCADMCSTVLPPSDLVVILDVLHYVDPAAQEQVLVRVREALAAGAADAGPGAAPPRLLLRVGDSARALGYSISQWVDHTVTRVRGHRVPPTWGRPLSDWIGQLERLGFAVRSEPMSQGTPFANVLLVADLKPTPIKDTI
ncbi:class I SAM-dependent methyltransferase [Variovorax dokdonensis]|uniref:Class I SAM-dependent methyltransferase n=1 Tax=Variovorax dokdonensis TaxID=344883 RepID=A0ABT7NC98_9BURK|nr:class I SAM-dependent methyltransferase [Variovorax dokdonensis]MDM0045569.1 class I SAM-dependent methyltransferase [Variovorax dokdonensis]